MKKLSLSVILTISLIYILSGCGGGVQGVTPSIDDKSKQPPVATVIPMTPYTLWQSKIPTIDLLQNCLNSDHYFTCDNWVTLNWNDHCYDSPEKIFYSRLLNCHRFVILSHPEFGGDYVYMAYTYDNINYYAHAFLITKQGNDYWLVSYSSGVLTVVKLIVHPQIGETPVSAALNYFRHLYPMTITFWEVENYWFTESTMKINERPFVYDERHPVPGLKEKL